MPATRPTAAEAERGDLAGLLAAGLLAVALAALTGAVLVADLAATFETAAAAFVAALTGAFAAILVPALAGDFLAETAICAPFGPTDFCSRAGLGAAAAREPIPSGRSPRPARTGAIGVAHH